VTLPLLAASKSLLAIVAWRIVAPAVELAWQQGIGAAETV
jgi:hypothetical protein